MADKANSSIVIGYGGYCKLSIKNLSGVVEKEVVIYVTSASVSINYTRPFDSTYNAPPNQESRSQIPLGVGVCSISGSINFDFSMSSIDGIINENFLCRNNLFDIHLSDGRLAYSVYDCCWNTFSINASPQSLVTGSISFIALNKVDKEPCCNIESYSPDEGIDNYFKNELVAYWEAGANYVESFSISFGIDVNPVYLNNKYMMPTYLRCGAISISASITSWKDWIGLTEGSAGGDAEYDNDLLDGDAIKINIAEKSILINNKVVTVKEFSHSGAADVGNHSYSVIGTVISSSKEKLFEIK